MPLSPIAPGVIVIVSPIALSKCGYACPSFFPDGSPSMIPVTDIAPDSAVALLPIVTAIAVVPTAAVSPHSLTVFPATAGQIEIGFVSVLEIFVICRTVGSFERATLAIIDLSVIQKTSESAISPNTDHAPRCGPSGSALHVEQDFGVVDVGNRSNRSARVVRHDVDFDIEDVPSNQTGRGNREIEVRG